MVILTDAKRRLVSPFAHRQILIFDSFKNELLFNNLVIWLILSIWFILSKKRRSFILSIIVYWVARDVPLTNQRTGMWYRK